MPRNRPHAPALILIFLAFLTVTHAARAQHGYIFNPGNDRGPFPGWVDSLMRRHLIGNLRWEAWPRYTPAQRDTLLDGLRIAGGAPTQWSRNESVILLAWSAIGPPRSETRPADLDLGLYDADLSDADIPAHRRAFNLLYLIRLDDTLHRARWALAVGTLRVDEEGEFNIALPRLSRLLDSVWVARAIAAEHERTKAKTGQIAAAEPSPPKGRSTRVGVEITREGSSPAALEVPHERLKTVRIEVPREYSNPVAIDADIDMGSTRHPVMIDREEPTAIETPAFDPRMHLFDHRPKSSEIYTFLDALSIGTGGPTRSARDFFDPAAILADHPGAVFTGGDVNEAAWREATGEEPRMQFPGEGK